MNSVPNEGAIRALVKTAVESYAVGFQSRHQAEVDDPEGTINMKIHNVFIAALGPEIQYYTALVRVLVQREMERERFPLASIPPFGRGFSRHGGLSIR